MKRMKHAMAIIAPVLAFALFLLTGCAKNKLQQAIDELNAKCPQRVTTFVRIMESSYDGEKVIARFELDDRLMKMDALKENKEMMKKILLASYSNPQGDVKDFFDVVLSTNTTVEYVYEGLLSGERFSLTITPEDLRQALEGNAASPDELLDFMLQVVNLQTPMVIADGFVMTTMRKEGDCVYYIYEISEPIYASIAANIDNVKADTRMNLENISEIEKADLRKIPAADKDLGYRYTCPETGDSIEFRFTKSQLADILR